MRRLAIALLVGGCAVAVASPGVASAQTLPAATVAVQSAGNPGGTATAPGCATLVTPFVDTVFVVTLSSASTDPIDVALSWGGTAVAGVDYANHPESVTLPANTATLTVPAAIDASAAGKTITLSIAAGAGYSVGAPATAMAEVALPVTPAICVTSPPPTPPIAASPEFTG